MGLILTGNSSTAQQTCIPCCQQNLNRCCTPELTAANTEKLYVHFHNFQMTPVPWMTFHIADFTVELRRIDLDLAWAAGTPNYTWFTHASEHEPTLSPVSPYSYFLHDEAQLQPVTVSITTDTIDDTGIPNHRMLPILDKNGSYFVTAVAQCMGSWYDVGFTLHREATTSDSAFYHSLETMAPAGQRSLIFTSQSTASGGAINSKAHHCGPLVASGRVGSILPGWKTPIFNAYTTGEGVVYFKDQTFANGVWSDSAGDIYSRFDPNFTMDWYLTE